MDKNLQRWYEQEEHLKAFMSLLEDLDSEKQCEIAVEIILRASEFSDREYDKIASEVGEYDPSEYKRWYDKNPNIHSAIEALKDLSQEDREAIINEFSEKILDSHYIKLEDIDE